MNLPKTSFLHRDIIKQHKVFTAIVVLQCLVILWLLVGLFRPTFSLTILPQDFSAAVEEKSDSQYQVQMSGENLQFQIANEAKRVPESEGLAEFEKLISARYSLPSGAYEVTINYETDSTSTHIAAAEISFEDCLFTNLIYGDPITITGARSSVTGRLWVCLAANANNVVAEIMPLGECNFQIQSIVMQEKIIYRVVRLLAILLLFTVLDCVSVAMFSGESKRSFDFVRKHWSWLILTVVGIWASLPLLNYGVVLGDDTAFHLVRITSLAQGIAEGQIPVRLYTDMLSGYGYATPLYYCDVFLYIPAILYNCMVPVYLCYNIYVALITGGTIFVSYYAFNKMIRNKCVAVTGTTVYVLSAYRLCDVYYRGAVGEYSAMMWLPLVVLGVYEIYSGNEKLTWKNAIPLAVGVSGILMCHVLSVEITAIFLVIFAILNLFRTFQPRRFITLLQAVCISLGLTGWFVVPLLQSMMTQNIQAYQNSYMWSFQSFGSTLYELLTVYPDIDTTSWRGALGVSLVLGSGISIITLLMRHRWGLKNTENFNLLKYGVLLGSFAAIASLRVFPWSTILSNTFQWPIFRMLGMVQFPWRYLTIATVLLTVAIVAALEIVRKSKKYFKQIIVAMCLVSVITSAISYTILFDGNKVKCVYDIMESQRTGFDAIMGGEYLLSKDVDWNYPRPSTQDEELLIKWYDKTDGVAHITLDNTGDTEATVVLPIYDYGNYHAVDTEGTEWTLGTSENSLLQLTVPAGYSGSFSIQYKEPIWWRAAELVSLATFAGLVGIWLKDKKKNRQLHKLPGDLVG